MNDASTRLDLTPEKSPVGTLLLWLSQKHILLLLHFQQQDAVEEHPLRSCCLVLVLADPAFALVDGSCCSSPYLV